MWCGCTTSHAHNSAQQWSMPKMETCFSVLCTSKLISYYNDKYYRKFSINYQSFISRTNPIRNTNTLRRYKYHDYLQAWRSHNLDHEHIDLFPNMDTILCFSFGKFWFNNLPTSLKCLPLSVLSLYKKSVA